MRSTAVALALSISAVAPLAACTGTVDDRSAQAPSFEQFEAGTYREVTGVYIVDGDTPVENRKLLGEFYDRLYGGDGALIVDTVGGSDDKWSDTQKLNLTYCISNSFGSNKAAVVAALAGATDSGWETLANVNFVYKSEYDATCTSSNTNVLFDVNPVNANGSYLARSFFPSSSRSVRNILIDSTAFGDVGWSLRNILMHECGHILGFRHEHTRPEAGTCFEDNDWRALTTYDSASIMHYPQCNGTSSDLSPTAKDKTGATSLYGGPGGGGGGGGGSTTTATFSGSVAASGWFGVKSYGVKAGSTFAVTMTGSGDPDLYVRFGSAPTTTSYTCRPYVDGASESCNVTVPAGTTTAYVNVRGYTAATFSATVTYVKP